jgi:hypothetical protein
MEHEAENQEPSATVVRRRRPLQAQTETLTSALSPMQTVFQEQEIPRHYLDGQGEDDSEREQSTPETVYAEDLQVVDETPSTESVEAGSPLPTQQRRRRMRSYTMRLSNHPAHGVRPPTHTRGSSDTATLSRSISAEIGMERGSGFTSINARRAHRDTYGLGHEREIEGEGRI